jgi:methionine aminotransferase
VKKHIPKQTPAFSNLKIAELYRMPEIKTKLPRVGTNIFTIMSGLAKDVQAINLGQGFPDFDMNPSLHEEVSKAMINGFNQYAPMPGWMPLREAIAEKIRPMLGTSQDKRW